MVEPLQLPLFPDRAALIRVWPDRGEARFYRLEVWPDLFGRALLVRRWGRIGSPTRQRLDPYPDPGAAINALARLAHARRRRGYRDRAADPADGDGETRPFAPVLEGQSQDDIEESAQTHGEGGAAGQAAGIRAPRTGAAKSSGSKAAIYSRRS